jgi:hypothetical protein
MNEEQIGQIEEQLEPYSQTTSCIHYMVLEDATTAICQNGCGHGCMFNPDLQVIVAGVITEKP